MNKELLRPVMRAVLALFLIVLVKLVAVQILKNAGGIYFIADIMLSLAVIIVLLRFRQEFNRQLAITSPSFAPSIVSGFVFLLVILTLYGTFSPYSDFLPFGLYHIIFFFLALIPVYSLWNILYKHTDRLSDLLSTIQIEEKTTCSCGWENPVSSKFCGRCGSPLPGK